MNARSAKIWETRRKRYGAEGHTGYAKTAFTDPLWLAATSKAIADAMAGRGEKK